MSIYDELGDMAEILDDFVIETNELIEQLNQDLLIIESSNDPEVINRIFRAFHTIKGTSGFLSFDFCMDLAHSSEDLLNKVRNGELSPNADIVDILLESSDWFKAFMDDIAERVDRGYDTTALQQRIASLLDDSSKVLPASEHQVTETESEPPDLSSFPAELIEEFINESHELIETVGNELMSLEIEPDNQNIINEVFRVFHTLKGNSALVGLIQMSEIAHKSEDILGKIREKTLDVETSLVDVLLDAVDYMRGVVNELKLGETPFLESPELLSQLYAILGEKPPTQNEGMDDGQSHLHESENGADPKKAPKTKKHIIEKTIRVDVNRIEKLMNIAGELVLEKNKLQLLSQRLKASHPDSVAVGEYETLNNSLGYITKEIQESIMGMRMLPIENVFRKFPRMVRDLAKEKGKQIDLIVSGQETEMDRSVIEAVGDPMVHLLRNAVDHAIEHPDDRVKIGKPPAGTIWLDAFQEGNQIMIRIKDDGQGIQADMIREKAMEKGLLSREEAAEMSPQELISLIFKPGFSTAKEVTDISGRGVGLDVVNTNISRLSGTIKLDSEPGVGTTFLVQLPLTLTILIGMVVGVHSETYIIPIGAIAETLRLESEHVSRLNGQDVIEVRDSKLPLVYLDKLLGVETEIESSESQYVVIVNGPEHQLGLVITRLFGQEETVVKPLGAALGHVEYLAGATLRGDGKVSLILDVGQLFSSHPAVEQVLT